LNKLNFVSARKQFDELQINTLSDVSEIDRALLNKIKCKINIETGNLKDALNLNNKAMLVFEKTFHKLDPIVISCNMDFIEANLSISNDLNTLKESIFQELAKATIVEDNYLIIRGYQLLSDLYSKSFNDRNSVDLNKKALKLYNSNRIKDNHLLYKIINNNAYDIKMNEKMIKKYEKLKDCHPKILYSLRKNKLLIIEPKKLYSSLEEVEKLINEVSEKYSNDMLLAKLYYIKFVLLEQSNKDHISDHYFERATEIVLKNYSPDSYANCQFLIFFIYQVLEKHIKNYKYEKALNQAYLNLNKNKLIYPNYNCLILYFCNLIFSLKKTNIIDISRKYGDFYNIHEKLIGQGSEALFGVNMLLRRYRHSVYDKYLN
jgi:hypothetical protein